MLVLIRPNNWEAVKANRNPIWSGLHKNPWTKIRATWLKKRSSILKEQWQALTISRKDEF